MSYILRMATGKKDSKMLWGRAAGRCSAPGCAIELLPEELSGTDIVIGEMAHIHGREPGSARYDPAVGANDTYENLILLCPNHHTTIDKAELDYPVKMLRQWKETWETNIRTTFLRRASLSGGASSTEMRLWNYYNFQVILEQYASLVPGPLPNRFNALHAAGVVNDDGFPLAGPNVDHYGSLFRSWPQQSAYALMQFYSQLVEGIVQAMTPIDLSLLWSVQQLSELVESGDVVFLNRGFGFKKMHTEGNVEFRRGRCNQNGIELVFQLETSCMYSSSAATTHYTGSASAATLLWLRSVTPKDGGKKLEIKSTPIALGTGFWKL